MVFDLGWIFDSEEVYIRIPDEKYVWNLGERMELVFAITLVAK